MKRREQRGDGGKGKREQVRRMRYREERWQRVWRGELKNPGRVKYDAAVWPPFPQALLTFIRGGRVRCWQQAPCFWRGAPCLSSLALKQCQHPSMEARGGFRASAELVRGCCPSPWCSRVKEDQATGISPVPTGIAQVQVVDSQDIGTRRNFGAHVSCLSRPA